MTVAARLFMFLLINHRRAKNFLGMPTIFIIFLYI
jgi:hypothetical protein